MRKKIIAANWKMHLSTHESSLLVHRLGQHIQTHRDIEVVLAPSFASLQPLSLEIDRRKFKLAAQNGFYKDEGAYTGEVSFTMLRGLVDYAIVGHSERRIYFNETLEMVRDKVQAAIRNKISPILCIGDTQNDRNEGATKQVLHDQLTTAISNLTADEVEDVVVAYEPIWAISTFGHHFAKPSIVKEEMDYIRGQISELYGAQTAERMCLIYGGSVDDSTAAGYLELEGCDGALVGGASLNYKKFSAIVESAHILQLKEKK